MSIFEICDPVVFLHGASASQNDAFPRAHQVERGNWDDLLGLPGVDGTQNDSTRTAKNGAERTIIMGNSIAIYCLELVPQKKIFEIQIAHKVPATRTEVFIPSYSLKGKSMKIGLISIYQMLISGMGSLSRTPEHSKAT